MSSTHLCLDIPPSREYRYSLHREYRRGLENLRLHLVDVLAILSSRHGKLRPTSLRALAIFAHCSCILTRSSTSGIAMGRGVSRERRHPGWKRLRHISGRRRLRHIRFSSSREGLHDGRYGIGLLTGTSGIHLSTGSSLGRKAR